MKTSIKAATQLKVMMMVKLVLCGSWMIEHDIPVWLRKSIELKNIGFPSNVLLKNFIDQSQKEIKRKEHTKIVNDMVDLQLKEFELNYYPGFYKHIKFSNYYIR
jgi:hypothetical protein